MFTRGAKLEASVMESAHALGVLTLWNSQIWNRFLTWIQHPSYYVFNTRKTHVSLSFSFIISMIKACTLRIQTLQRFIRKYLTVHIPYSSSNCRDLTTQTALEAATSFHSSFVDIPYFEGFTFEVKHMYTIRTSRELVLHVQRIAERLRMIFQ